MKSLGILFIQHKCKSQIIIITLNLGNGVNTSKDKQQEYKIDFVDKTRLLKQSFSKLTIIEPGSCHY